MKTLPFYLLEANDRIMSGDFYIRLERGNVPVPTLCDPSWKGTPIGDCPEGVYLRRIQQPGAVTNKAAESGGQSPALRCR